MTCYWISLIVFVEIRLVVYTLASSLSNNSMKEISDTCGSPEFVSLNIAAFATQLALKEAIENFWKVKEMIFFSFHF